MNTGTSWTRSYIVHYIPTNAGLDMLLLRKNPEGKRFGNDEMVYWKNAGYRYDFYEKPNEFREMMMQNKIAAYLSDRRQGCGNLMDYLPLLTFKNEKENGEYLHFYCIKDLCKDDCKIE